jgi:hypothetical protein
VVECLVGRALSAGTITLLGSCAVYKGIVLIVTSNSGTRAFGVLTDISSGSSFASVLRIFGRTFDAHAKSP